MRRATVAWAAAIIAACGLLALPVVAFAATSAVTIQNSAFNPPTTTVRVGDTVTWTNVDALSHTSTSDTGLWDTGLLATGSSGKFTFTSAGAFAYHCAIHQFMKGTVMVLAANTPPPTPPPTPVRTAPPTVAPTAAPTAPPTETATALVTTPAPTASPSPTSAAAETLTASASPSPVAVQLTPAPAPGSGPGPLLLGAAALAVVALGAIAFFLVRRS